MPDKRLKRLGSVEFMGSRAEPAVDTSHQALFRSIVFCSMATAIVLATKALWLPFLLPIKLEQFSYLDQMIVSVPNGSFEDVQASVVARSLEEQENAREIAPDITVSGSTIMIRAGAIRAGESAALSVTFVKKAIEILPYCNATDGLAEIVPINELDYLKDPIAFAVGNRPIVVVRLPVKDGGVVYTCELPDRVVWAHDRHKNYFSAPRVYVKTWGSGGRPSTTPNPVRQLSARTCASVSYRVGEYERLDTVNAEIPNSETVDSGSRVWETCETKFENESWDEANKILNWTTVTPTVISRFITIDLTTESLNERNLFLSGIALGLAGALLVEALALLVTVLQTRVPFNTSNLSGADAAQSPPRISAAENLPLYDDQIRSQEEGQPTAHKSATRRPVVGFYWSAYSSQLAAKIDLETRIPSQRASKDG